MSQTIKKRGRPRIKGEKKVTRSIRIKPSQKKLIEEKYKSVQVWFDLKLANELEGIKNGIDEEKN